MTEFDACEQSFKNGYDKAISETTAKVRECELKLKALQSKYNDCRNYLCEKCGKYHNAHLGACDTCRWRE